jgi:hypothetical protein
MAYWRSRLLAPWKLELCVGPGAETLLPRTYPTLIPANYIIAIAMERKIERGRDVLANSNHMNTIATIKARV